MKILAVNISEKKGTIKKPVDNIQIIPIKTVPEKTEIQRFITDNDGTVLDTKTNLMWAAKDNGKDIDWEEASLYCINLSTGGHQNWRMPTQHELVGLYEAGIRTSDSPGIHSPLITNWWVWGSDSKSKNVASSLIMKYGYTRWSYKSVSYFFRVLPVREIP